MTCNYEKMEIANAYRGNYLNKRNELISSCVHFADILRNTDLELQILNKEVFINKQ